MGRERRAGERIARGKNRTRGRNPRLREFSKFARGTRGGPRWGATARMVRSPLATCRAGTTRGKRGSPTTTYRNARFSFSTCEWAPFRRSGPAARFVFFSFPLPKPSAHPEISPITPPPFHPSHVLISIPFPTATPPQPASVPAAQAFRDEGVGAEAPRLCAAPGGGCLSRSEDKGTRPIRAFTDETPTTAFKLDPSIDKA